MTHKTKIEIADMDCASCAVDIEKEFNKVEGIKEANVNYANGKAIIKHSKDTEHHKITEAVEKAGYTVKGSLNPESEINYKKEAIQAWTATIPVVGLMILSWANIEILTDFQINLFMLLFSTPVILYYGRNTFSSAINGLKQKNFNMDSLIMLGTLAAYSTGLMVFFTPVQNYAGLGAMIMASHLVGTHLENKAKGKASTAIQDLLKLKADTATVIKDGAEKEINVEEVKVGDKVIVKPGEKIPVDGEIIEGETNIDESMATGESDLANKKQGDEVIGSTVNQTGMIKIRATKVGEDTFFSQVVDLVEEAQGSKVPIEDYADKVTHVFVPTVIAIAALTLIIWIILPEQMMSVAGFFEPYIPWIELGHGTITLAIFATVAVLVIACPCALGLATPTALMVGTGKAAENGILYRDGEAIQTMKDIDTIILDKTGTITKGKPEVTDLESEDKNKLLELAASVEKGSEHPLGQAIIEKAQQKQIELVQPIEFESFTGKGAKAKIREQTIYVGNEKLLDQYSIEIKHQEKAEELKKQGKTTIYVADKEKTIGVIAVADAIKEGSKEAVRQIQERGMETWMITGDNQKTANVIAKEVGIENVMSEVLPQDKIEKVEQLQNQGKTVAMVGDGINDAPALKQANVGIAIGTGTDIAIESSDVNIVKGKLSSIITAFNLSDKIFAKIKQNLFWAFIYNVVAIPIAFIGILHPLIAMAAMFASSISVVTNSTRLKSADI